MRKFLFIFILPLVCSLVAAQVSKTINSTSAGTLSSLLTATERTTITSLAVTGNIDARDIKFLRDELVNLTSLDMSLVKIKAYSGIGGPTPNENSYTYPDNEIPQFSLSKDETVFNSTLRTIYLPNSITSIGLYALRNCSGLTSLVIPSSVILIGDWVFRGCTSLKTITCLSTSPPAAGMSFGGISLTAVYVPFGTVSAYNAVLGWSLFKIVENVLKVSTQSVGSITLSTAILNANLDFIATTPIIAHGFCWNSTGSPTIINNKIDNGVKTTMGLYSNSMSGLLPLTTYFVKAFATDGERTVYGNEVSFTTASIPVASNSILGPQNVCQGQNSVTYTVPAIAYATSYIWTLPDGATGASTTNSISVSYNKTFTLGNISVKGHNEWGDGSNTTLAIMANLLPENAGIITGSISVCQGESSIIYSVPTIHNATSYIWSLPTGVTGTSTTNSITVNYLKNALSGYITVKGHNDCGDGAVNLLPVSVSQLPVISITNKTIICGGSVSLSPTINYTGNGILRYKWTPSTGLNNDTIANPTANITNDVSYTITVNTPSGCTTSANINVNVSALTANAGADKSILCGGTISLNGTTNYTGNGILKYKWTPATGLNNDTIANPSATVTNDRTYTVTVITPEGCTASDDILINITPMNKPQIGIVSVNSSNKNIVVWDKPITKGIESYSVFRETSISDVYEKIGSVPYDSLSVFVDNQSAADVKSNKYKISILDKSGQESLLSDAHKTMHLSINKGQNNTWNLIWEPYNGFNATTYNIYRGTNTSNLNFLDAVSGSSTQYSDILAPSGDVYYQLEVISPTLINPTKVSSLQRNKNSENTTASSLATYNSSRSNIASNLINGIDGLTENNNINIYPNPVINELKIDFKGGSTFEILNLMGQVVYNGNLNMSEIVQTTSLTAGIYLIRFKTGKTFEYIKIIKK